MDDICISINEISHPVLCGLCNRPIAFFGEADDESRKAGCVPCGNVAEVDEVAKIAIEYAKDEGQLVLNRMAQDAARKAKFVNFKGQTSHNKTHRFIVDLKL